MRRLYAAVACLALAVILSRPATPTQAQETPNPFPSQSPQATPASGNGYISLGFNFANTSGGRVLPQPGSTSTPTSFMSSGATGFSIDLLGRVAPLYVAGLTFDDYSVHGSDHPFVSYAHGSVLFNPRSGPLGFGLGFISAQRSTSNANTNGLGVGLQLLPDFRERLTFGGSVFVYPSLRSAGATGALTTINADLIFAPARRGGLFLKLGFQDKTGGPSTTSPTSISGVTAGIGSEF